MKKLLLIAILMLALVITAVACNNDPVAEETTADTTAADTTAADTTAADTTAADTTAADTTAADTTAEDTTAEDTTVEDTTVEDTTAEDTTAEDTTAEDTTAEDTTVEDTTAEDTTAEDTTAEDTTAVEKGTYNVRVVDANDRALAGATVEFYVGNDCKYSQATNESGVVSIELDKIDYTVKVTLEGYTGEASYSLTATSRMIKVTLTKVNPDPEPETTPAPETAPYDKDYWDAKDAEIIGFQWIQYLVDDVQMIQAWGYNGADSKSMVNFDGSPADADPYVIAAGATSFGYYGWFGVSDDCETDPCMMGYAIDGGEIVYDASFMTDSNDGAMALLPGAVSAPNIKVMVPLTGLTGAHTIQIFYKSAAGVVVQMDMINVVISSDINEPETNEPETNEPETNEPETLPEPYPTSKLPFAQALETYVFGIQWSQYKIDGVQAYFAWPGSIAQGVSTFAGEPVATPLTLPAGTLTFGYYGWVGVSDDCRDEATRGVFGYSIDGGDAIFSPAFFWMDGGNYCYHNQGVFDGNFTPGAASAPSFDIVVDLAGLTGAHTIESFYKAADGTVILLDSIDIVIEIAPETDPVETDPVETDPVETDPVETDPVETDPVETEIVNETIVLAQYNGSTTVQNAVGATKYGLQFNMGDGILKKFTIDRMATFADSVNTWTLKIWNWNTDYATTIDGTVLYETSGANHADSTDFIVTIPDGVVITGEVLVEITYDSGATAFTGWVGINPVAGYQCYLHGMSDLSGTPVQPMAASVVVEKVVIIDPNAPETDPEETDPVETDPVETDPVETDPVETDPVETDPVEPGLYDKTYWEAKGAEIKGFQWIQYLVDEVQMVQAWGYMGADSKNVVNFDGTPASADPYVIAAGSTSFGYYGWLGIGDAQGNQGVFGYSIDGAEVVYNTAFTISPHNGGVWEGGMNLEAASVPDIRVTVPLSGLTGSHTIQIFYKSAAGVVVQLDLINVLIASDTIEPYPTEKQTFAQALNTKVFGIQWSQYKVNGAQTYQAWAGQGQSVTDFNQVPVSIPILLPEGTLTFGYYGWIGVSDDCRNEATRGIFGYSIDGGDAIFSPTFFWMDGGNYCYHNQGVFDGNLTPGAASAPSFDIVVDLTGLENGTHTVESFYKAADGTVILLDSIQIAIGFVTVEPEPEIDGDTVVLSQFNGCTAQTYWNDDSTSKIGQRFNIGTSTLKQLTVYSLATFEGSQNTFTVSFWQWDSNYETTVAGTPLYVYNGSNHADSTDFVLTIPEDVILTGDIYYEINVLTSVNVLPNSPAVFMTWIGIDQVEGLASYRGGVLWDTNYASSIVVKKVTPEDPDTLPLAPEVFGPETEKVDLFDGAISDVLQNPNGQTLGLLVCGGDILTEVGIYNMAVADGSNPDDWVVTIYEFTDDYATTVSGEALLETTGTIDRNGNYVINLPIDMEINCDILVVIEGMQPGDSGYIGEEPWYDCFLDGELADNAVAAYYAYLVPEEM